MTAAMVLEDAEWGADALATIIALSLVSSQFTADTLRQEMRPPPHPGMVGAAFSAARNLGYITAAGYTTSTTPSRHHGVVRVWTRKKES